jgi:hypothetical protein
MLAALSMYRAVWLASYAGFCGVSALLLKLQACNSATRRPADPATLPPCSPAALQPCVHCSPQPYVHVRRA